MCVCGGGGLLWLIHDGFDRALPSVQAHLTLLMLKLPNPPQVEAAAATLDSATAELHALASKHSGSPTVVLRGLACMVRVGVAQVLCASRASLTASRCAGAWCRAPERRCH